MSDQTNPVPPSDLAPALVGALVTGHVRDEQIEATILDFARRGLLAIEPAGAEQGQIRLLSDGKRLTGYEKAVWTTLSDETDGDDIVFSSHLPTLRLRWAGPKDLLRQELARRGWFNPTNAALRRRPLYLAGGIGVIAILIGIIVAAVAQEGWALLGMLIFLTGVIAAFVLGHSVPDTSAEGQQVAAPWRSYLATIKAGRHIPDLDAALPYAVAAARGDSLASFRRGDVGQAEGSSFYPYWTALHAGMYPVSSGGTSGGGFAGGGGGGAASGGGGAGGAF